MSNVHLSTFRAVPDFARGLVRDLRVRWTLEELGRAYETAPITFDERTSAAYRALNPFGQIPAIRSDGTTMFESGAILFALADGSHLVRPGTEGRNATLTWMFAALNTVEPDVALLFTNDLIRTEAPWAKLARPDVAASVEGKLAVLEAHLESRDYLVEDFTVADVLMVTVLRFLQHTDMLDRFPTIASYVARCSQRPAFERALNAQLAAFDEPMAA